MLQLHNGEDFGEGQMPIDQLSCVRTRFVCMTAAARMDGARWFAREKKFGPKKLPAVKKRRNLASLRRATQQLHRSRSNCDATERRRAPRSEFSDPRGLAHSSAGRARAKN